METKIRFFFEQQYLPSKRHRKPRIREMEKEISVEVRELTEAEFPVAMVVSDYASLYRGAKSYEEINKRDDGVFQIVEDEIRLFNKQLYKAVRISYGAAISDFYEEPKKVIRDRLLRAQRRDWHEEPVLIEGQVPIIISDNSLEVEDSIKKQAEEFVIYDGKLWEACGEPRYVIITFGLGHNHGGTEMFIEYFYNPNIGAKNYFNALQKEAAVAYANAVAERRGDTNDVGKFGATRDIKVLIPEAVTLAPLKEHGEGDVFMNRLNSICEGADTAKEAGMLCILGTLMEIAK